ncbi:MAG: glycosyltransferase family 4 protein [Pseudomonadota bacterium]
MLRRLNRIETRSKDGFFTPSLMHFLYSHRTRSADGQYVHIKSLTDALSARGNRLTICGPDDRGGVETSRLLNAGQSASTSPRRASSLGNAAYEVAELAYSAVGYQRLLNATKQDAPDVVYERYNLFYHAGVRYARSRNKPLILEINAPLAQERQRHSGLALNRLAQWSERSIWRAADAVLPVTQALADMVSAAGVPRERITVIQNGVDETFLGDVSPESIRSRYGLTDKLVLGFTGFVRAWHGVDRVLRFMARSECQDLHLLLVGDGPERPSLEALANDLGIADRLTVTGVVQRDALPKHVAAFDIALQPASVDYASPLKLFEYMALRRPILAPAQPNIQEILTDNRDAVLFDPLDVSSFEYRLEQLVEGLSLRERLGGEARSTLERSGLTWANNSLRVEEIASRLVKERQV